MDVGVDWAVETRVSRGGDAGDSWAVWLRDSSCTGE
jgi:hypothetical protein